MRKCKVFVNGICAGILHENDTRTEYKFKYNKDYTKYNLPPVSLTMPVREKEYRSAVLFPYFFNILSEGENRTMQSSYLHIDKDDDFGIL